MKYHKQQTKYTCGPACMKMVLSSLDIRKTEKQLAKLLHTNKRTGTWNKYIPFVGEKYNLDYIVKREGSVSEIKKLLKNKWKIIVCYQNDGGHYAVVKKITLFKIHLYDPLFGPKVKFSLWKFKKIWYDGENKLPWFVAMKKSKSNNFIHIKE